MSSSQFTIYLLTFALFLQTIFGDKPVSHYCLSSVGNFTSNDPYRSNLNVLLGNLYNQTPLQGFGLGSVGLNPYQTYGPALCRRDVDATYCKTCVSEASNEISKRCPYNKRAIIWNHNCLLKYLNTDFFHQIDLQNQFFMTSTQNANDPTTFNKITRELLSKLSKEATLTPELYAGELLDLAGGDSKKLYGMVQCTRDLSSNNCFKCLDSIIAKLPS